jgi:hypothetical protein
MNPLERALQDGLTVKELIESLEEFEPNTRVVFKYPSGDYWKTELAAPVITLDEGYVTYSQYHNKPKVDEGESEADGLTEQVIIINL